MNRWNGPVGALIKTAKYIRRGRALASARRIVRSPLVWYWERIDQEFDRRWGTNTSGMIEERLSRRDAIWYEPTGFDALRRTLGEIDTTCYPVLVDYGSGKGRVLLVASEYDFSRIIGVEISRKLHDIAEQNISTYCNPQQRCTDVVSLCMDAVEFELPTDPSVLFFFSPFVKDVMKRVHEEIQSSASRKPRDMAMIYVGSNPEFIASLDSFGWDKQDLGYEWNARRSTKYRLLVYRRNSL